jgi:glycosyltransferase involved in cell wall biosynthesis
MREICDEVWVLTRSNNRSVIEADPLNNTPGLHFIYYDLPGWALRLKKQAWFFRIYCTLWQWGAYRVAARSHREKQFDCVFHVTFASMQFGSYMGRLGIPFVIGPVAGGERSPLRLRAGIPLRGKVSELLRDLGIEIQRFNPLTRRAYAAARYIYVATSDSLRLVPPKWHHKTAIQLAIATRGDAIRDSNIQMQEIPRFLFAGRLLHWKGVHLAIRALAEALRAIPVATLTIVGQGPAEPFLRASAEKCGVINAVTFVGHVPRQQLIDSMLSYTALVFPSLHDSGGLAVLEAFSKGLPAISLDLGGPGIIVNESCGIVVSTRNGDEDRVVTGLAKAIVVLATMAPAERERLSIGAVARANQLSWSTLTAVVAGSETGR